MRKLRFGVLLILVLSCRDDQVTLPEIDRELLVILKSLPQGEYIAVSGKVISIENVSEQPAMISEHDPQPKVALVKVCRVLVGEVTSNTIKIAFAASRDVAWWNQTIKFEQGSIGTWILSINAPASFRDFYPSVFSESDVYVIENSTTDFYDKAFCPVK